VVVRVAVGPFQVDRLMASYSPLENVLYYTFCVGITYTVVVLPLLLAVDR